MTLFTIGHSNHPFDALRALLLRHGIEGVADVRSSPYSQYAPQSNRETLRDSLQDVGIEYRFVGDALGGRPAGDGFYDDLGRVLYDRIAASAGFQDGIDRLIHWAERRRVALLCSEEDPTDCHRRRLIARVLRDRGVAVVHLRGDGRAETEEEVAREEERRKTGGQRTLFELEEADSWRSTRSVSRRTASVL